MLLRVGIIQPNYLPWRGYFDFIREVDLFIFFDDLQYTNRDWRNRNRLKTPTGLQWITVPVKYRERSQLISETQIDESQDWRRKHLNTFKLNYAKTPYFDAAYELFERCIAVRDVTISELNIIATAEICAYLDIATNTMRASQLNAQGLKTERIIDIMQRVGGTTYLSGPSAQSYLDKSALAAADISLEIKEYNYAPYPQQWGAFAGGVSVIDLIANCGCSSMQYLKPHVETD